MVSITLLSWFYLARARAEFSDWCGDAAMYRVKVGGRAWDVRVGDGGRVCDDNIPANLRPVTRFSPLGGLTAVSSHYAFFGGRVRLGLHHLKLRCAASRECQPLRAGERCGILNPETNVWPGAEAEFTGAAPSPSGRLAFDRVAWNALVGVARAREALADRARWASFGLSEDEITALAEDLDFSRRHCEALEAPRANGVLSANRVGVLEGARLVPLAELIDHRWQVSDTTFRSLYRRFDAAPREIWGLRTAATTPYASRWSIFDQHRATSTELALPFLITPDEVIERRGFFTGAEPTAVPRVISDLAGTKDPEGWRSEKPNHALQRRARELFRQDHPRRFECLPRVDGSDDEQLREVGEAFGDQELDVYRAFVARTGDILVAVRVSERCRQPVISETSLPTVLQRHWYFVPKSGAPRLVAKAKEAWLAIDFDQDGLSEWVFTSYGVDERAPYYYGMFARPKNETLSTN